jgi:CubicO group peptidase (beta-lactamase class C family)
VIADRLESLLQEHVAAGEVLGLAWLVAEGDDVRTGVLGSSDAGGTQAVAPDTIFRISSLSKPIVAAAAMALVDSGRLAVDDPIERWIPELAGRRVLRAPDSSLDDTVPANRAITVRDLLVSTMGIGWDFDFSRPQTVMQALSDRGLSTTPPLPASWRPVDEWLGGLRDVPNHYQPGDRWLYHTSYDVLGALIGRVAGKSLGTFLEDTIFGPLGMVDTAFCVPPEKQRRFGACFGGPTPDGRAVYDPPDGQWATPPVFESGGGGLVSTIADYFAFVDMLRRGGRDVLSAGAVRAMTTNQLTDAQIKASGPEPGDDIGWGYGVSVQAGATPAGLPVGTYGWDGGLGSIWRSDPTADVVGILLTNQAFLTPDPLPITRSVRSVFTA